MKIGSRLVYSFLSAKREENSDVLNHPIELALPLKINDFRDKASDIVNDCKGLQIESLHAPVLWLHHESIDDLFLEITEVANALECYYVTVHPEKIAFKLLKDEDTMDGLRKYVVDIITHMEAVTGVSICIETFLGRQRLFAPEHLLQYELESTLDTSHMNHPDDCVGLLDAGLNCPIIHLSEFVPETNERHLPITKWSEYFIGELHKRGWNGTIILEYLQEHHYKYPEDIKRLNGILSKMEAE